MCLCVHECTVDLFQCEHIYIYICQEGRGAKSLQRLKKNN